MRAGDYVRLDGQRDRIIALHAEGLSWPDVARAVGVSHPTLLRERVRMGITDPATLRELRWRRVEAQYGMSIEDVITMLYARLGYWAAVAAELEMTTVGLWGWRKALGMAVA